jgi:uncharacterized protein (DUF362 family)
MGEGTHEGAVPEERAMVERGSLMNGSVGVFRVDGGVRRAVEDALRHSGVLSRVRSGMRVALKPNLTYPFYRKGVTTSPIVIREAVRVLRDFTPNICVVESDGGYGAWQAEEAFAGHGLYEIGKEYSVQIVSLGKEDWEFIRFNAKGRTHRVPLPKRLLYSTDLLISMPVPKIHCMTIVSLGMKNQWGCIPDPMRLRMHHVFNQAIVAINKLLNPAVLADGMWFLNNNGPMEGDAIECGLVIGASDVWSFDRYMSAAMMVPWKRVPHLKRAVREGVMPPSLASIRCNVPASEVGCGKYGLRRTVRNYIALTAFRSRVITWFGYESWFGRVVLHALLYALAGKPPAARPDGGFRAGGDR